MNLKEHQLKLSEYKFLASLLESGISLQDALPIIENRSNSKHVQHILDVLGKGESLTSVFFVNDRAQSLFFVLNQLYPLHEAIRMCVEYKEALERQLKNFIHSLIYPSIIIAVSFIVMLIGTFIIVPEIYNMFESMNIHDSKAMLVITQILVILLGLVIMGLVVCGAICLVAYKQHKVFLIFEYIRNSRISVILRIIITYIFLSTYNLFLSNHLSSKEIQTILLKMDENSIERVVGEELEMKFLQGLNFTLALQDMDYIDERAKQLVKVGYITGKVDVYVNVYINEVNEYVKKVIKGILYGIQAMSYISVGLCVMTITNLLFAPLSVLESM